MRILFFDVETKILKETEHKIYQDFRLGTANLVNYRPEGSFTIIGNLQWKQKEAFYKWVISCLQEKQLFYILSANIWFDIRNSGLFIWLIEAGWKPLFFHSKGMTTIIKLRLDKYTIVFLNMQQIIPGSVKEYGEMVGLPKLDTDVHTDNDDELMTYCQRDTDIITEVFKQWLYFIRSNDLGKFGLTLASQAFMSFRYRFMHTDIYIHRTKPITEFEHHCYWGGRTEIFSQGEVNDGTIFVLDINSMYPAVMRDNLMPVKWVSSFKLPGKARLAYFLARYICLALVSLDTDDPAYPVKHNGRLCFPVGRFTAYLSHPELVYAWKHGHIKDVGYIVTYKGEKIFTDYVNFFHNLKQEYTEAGNKPYRTMTKLFMNSLYGKFAQRVDVPFFEDELKESDYSHETVIDMDTGKRYKQLCLGKFRRVFEEGAGDANNSLVAIPAHITGLSRMKLWHLIKKAGMENVHYCDTDSLYVNAEGYRALQNEIEDGVLGKLELEKTTTNLVIHAPKDYSIDGVETIKGVRLGSKRNPDGSFATLQFPGFRSDVRGDLNQPYAINKINKTLSRKYLKGEVLPSGRVKPFNLREF